MFLVNVNEAFGYSHEQTLDSCFSSLKNMLLEHNYMWYERNKKDEDEDGADFEWIELPDWDDPVKTNKIRKYKDVGGIIASKNNV